MKIWSTKHNHQVIHLNRTGSNCYLVRNGSHFLMIDTGWAIQWEDREEVLNLTGVNSELLDALILTHAHYDHAGLAARIKRQYDAPVIAHRLEAPLLKKGRAQFPKGSLILTQWILKKLEYVPAINVGYRPVEPDILVDETLDLEDIGFNVRIIHTPGHSAGSISVIVDNEIALVGDAMFGVKADSIFPPIADDPRQMVTTWRKLLETGANLYLPGHGGEVSRHLLQSEWEKYQEIYQIQ